MQHDSQNPVGHLPCGAWQDPRKTRRFLTGFVGGCVQRFRIFVECLAPNFLDSELSLFMLQLRVQGAAGELGRA